MNRKEPKAHLRARLRVDPQVPEPAVDDLTQRVARRQHRAKLGALIVGVTVFAVPFAIFLAFTRDEPPAAAGDAILSVDCGRDGLAAGDSVQASNVGVRVLVTVAAGYTTVVDGNGGVTGSFTLPTRPGSDNALQCLGPNLEPVSESQFTVLDPMGYWMPPFGDCSDHWGSEGTSVAHEPDLQVFGRSAFGSPVSGDKYRWTGYPDSEQELHVDLVRDGKAVASAMFENDGNTWFLTGGTGPCS